METPEAHADFERVIVGFVVFMLVKAVNTARKPALAAAPPPTPEDVILLREIRDALKR